MTPTERPILFSGAMVRAIQCGAKTQTRRVVVPQPQKCEVSFLWRGGPKLKRAGYGANYVHTDLAAMVKAMIDVCPYGNVGDRLWVRETWRPLYPHRAGKLHASTATVQYAADQNADPNDYTTWKPSIHMPREASRINLELTMVRVERVQQITEYDARQEGVEPGDLHRCYPSRHAAMIRTYQRGFELLWDKLNAKRGYGWDINPWVYVLEFKKV